MTDIVERLLSTHNDTWPRQIGYGDLNNEDGPEAADEIERLRAALHSRDDFIRRAGLWMAYAEEMSIERASAAFETK